MQKTHILVWFFLGLMGCDSAPHGLHSRLTISLGLMENVKTHVRAYQEGVELAPVEVNATEANFVLVADVETVVDAVVFELDTTLEQHVNSQTLESESRELVNNWTAWQGKSDVFFPAAGDSTEVIRLTFDEAPVEFLPYLEGPDFSGEQRQHPWRGVWPGVHVTDTDLSYELPSPLAQVVGLPADRLIELTAVTPTGVLQPELLHNTAELGPEFEISLGTAPSPLPNTHSLEIGQEELSDGIDFSHLFSMADPAYSLECHAMSGAPLELSPAACAQSEDAAEWLPCHLLSLTPNQMAQVELLTRYAELPTLGCSHVVVTMTDLAVDPCATLICDDGFLCVQNENQANCIEEPHFSVLRVASNDEQFLVATESGFGEVSFQIETNGAQPGFSGTGQPVLGAARLAEDGTMEVSELPGVSCMWELPAASAGRQKINCSSTQALHEEDFFQSVAIVQFQYALAGYPDSQFEKRYWFRVLGLPDTTNVPVITRVVPASNTVSNQSQFGEFWTQVSYYTPTHLSDAIAFDLRVEGDLLNGELGANGADSIGANTSYPAEWNFKMWEGETLRSDWTTVGMYRVAMDDPTLQINMLALKLSSVDEDGASTALDAIRMPFHLENSPPEFVHGGSPLRFAADGAAFGEPAQVELPVRGLGTNEGGYVFYHNFNGQGEVRSISGDAREQAAPNLMGLPGSYQMRVGSLSAIATSDLGELPTSTELETLDSVMVEMVRPATPAILLPDSLWVENQSYSLQEAVGTPSRLLWDPIMENLVVVGQLGIQLFRMNHEDDDGISNWESMGVISNPCEGEIADAVVSFYQNGSFASVFGTDAESRWHSKVVLLVKPAVGTSGSTGLAHCWLVMDELDSAEQVAEFNPDQESGTVAITESSLGNGSCAYDTINSSNGLALGYQALQGVYWVLSNGCVAGYRVDPEDDALEALAVSQLDTNIPTSSYSPETLTIDSHTGVAIASYESQYGYGYKRFILGSDVQQSPAAGQLAQYRENMFFDPSSGWTWQLAALEYDGQSAGEKFYSIFPSVGELAPTLSSDTSAFSSYGFGMNRGVLDVSRRMLHTVEQKFTVAPNLAITQHAFKYDHAGLRVTSVLETPLQDGPHTGSGDSVQVVDMVLMGPQLHGGLPPVLVPGAYVTLRGENFSGDIEQDKVCVQGVCVAPVRSTTTALTFQVPAVFAELDEPLLAHVTVDDGHFMSGPAPGEALLMGHSKRWRAQWAGWAEVSCTDATGGSVDCSDGSIIQTPTGTYLTMTDGPGTSSAYQANVMDGWIQLVGVSAPQNSCVTGSKRVPTPGSGGWICVAAAGQGERALAETRALRPMHLSTNELLPATEHFHTSIQQSVDYSASTPLWQNSSNIDSSLGYGALLLSDDVSQIAMWGNSEWWQSDRHLANFTSVPAWFNEYSEALASIPGRGGLAAISRNENESSASLLSNFGDTTFASFDMNETCGWSFAGAAEEIQVHGTRGPVAAIALGMLGMEPFEIGMVALVEDSGGNLDMICHRETVDVAVEASQEIDGGIAVAPNGEFVAVYLNEPEAPKLKVWQLGTEIELIVEEGLHYPATDMVFSESGDELFVLAPKKLGVLKFSRSPTP